MTKHLNCIVVFNHDKDKILFCKRKKEPYRGLYNFVGGKVEAGEFSEMAAYRELKEETGIGRDAICLSRLMDLTYYAQDFVLEIYVGQLNRDAQLREEVNPLYWLPLTEDFGNSARFAGDGNILHIVNMALKYPLREHEERTYMLDENSVSVGIDSCKGGWVAAVIKRGKLEVQRFPTINEFAMSVSFDSCLIDMVIGLQGNENQVRPDGMARKMLKGRASTIFPAPCRRAVYGRDKEERLQANFEVLHKRFPSQTDAIIPKIREVDEFLQSHMDYKNFLRESHPEVCFSCLKESVVMTSKHDSDGIRERIAIINPYFPEVTEAWTSLVSKQIGCKKDDLLDAVCLAIVANLDIQGKTETIPRQPEMDDTGLLMQMVIPKADMKDK